MNKILREDVDQIISDSISWEKLKDSVVLITGASGMIGSYMLYVLTRLNDLYKSNIKIICMVRHVDNLPEAVRAR